MESDDVYSIIASGLASAGKLIAQLVTDERDLDEPGPDGMCLLHVAATYGHAEIVTTLLDSKASVDPQDDSGLTPLMLAANDGHVDVVNALLTAGADVSLVNNDSHMMLGVTVTDGIGSIPIASTGGRTALHFAASRGNDACVTALLPSATTANIVNQRDNTGCTPLYSALLAGHNDTARIIDPTAAPLATEVRQSIKADLYARLQARISGTGSDNHSTVSHVAQPAIIDTSHGVTITHVHASSSSAHTSSIALPTSIASISSTILPAAAISTAGVSSPAVPSPTSSSSSTSAPSTSSSSAISSSGDSTPHPIPSPLSDNDGNG